MRSVERIATADKQRYIHTVAGFWIVLYDGMPFIERTIRDKGPTNPFYYLRPFYITEGTAKRSTKILNERYKTTLFTYKRVI